MEDQTMILTFADFHKNVEDVEDTSEIISGDAAAMFIERVRSILHT